MLGYTASTHDIRAMRYLDLNTSDYFTLCCVQFESWEFLLSLLYHLIHTAFNTARGYNIEQENYLDHLRKGYKDLHSVSENLTNLKL